MQNHLLENTREKPNGDTSLDSHGAVIVPVSLVARDAESATAQSSGVPYQDLPYPLKRIKSAENDLISENKRA